MLIASATIGLLSTVDAAALTLEQAATYQGVERNVSQVKSDLEQAQCGGWDLTKSVADFIPKVDGAPGREGIVMENGIAKKEVLWSGMAWRNETAGAKRDGFLFPDTNYASGLSTVCGLNEYGPNFPYTDDPTATGNVPCTNETDCRDRCTKLNFWQYALADCYDIYGIYIGGWSGECQDRAAEGNARNLPDGCYVTQWNYCCSNSRVTDEATDAERNCLTCSGDGLEDPDTPGVDANGQAVTDLFETGCRKGKEVNGRTYLSFFRTYVVSYHRSVLQTGSLQNDSAIREGIPVECYGQYEEYDPKEQRTVAKDQRCVIDLNNRPPDESFQNMRQSQTGKGEYGVNEHGDDPPFPRPDRPTVGDLWVTKVSDAVSFVNVQKVAETYGKNAPLSMLPLDSVDITSTVAGSKDKPISDASLIRATDDTVSNDRPGRRTIVEWWQEQETAMQRLFTPPIVRLILPFPRSLGLDPADPFLTPPTSSTWVQNPRSNPRSEVPRNLLTIDAQLKAGEDLVSEVSAYLERSLLSNIQEEPVTVVVPLASAVELRSLAQGWYGWAQRQEQGEGRTKAEAIAQKLEGYADRIDDVRAMRAELARTLQQILVSQADIASHITEWLQANAEGLRTFQTAWTNVMAVKPQWEEVQKTYRRFHDVTNMPWCRNDRFTTPIYSLLDSWMPGMPGSRDLVAGIDSAIAAPSDTTFPRIKVDPLPDLVYDLTALRVSTGTVRIPVLKPLQIRLDVAMFAPPAFYTSVQDLSPRLEKLSNIGDLPPVPTISQTVIDMMLPTSVIVKSEPAVIRPSIPVLPDTAPEVLFRMQAMLTAMNETYSTFWQSLTQQQESYDCAQTGTMPCIHTEMDLRERFTRIGARPAIQLKEDFAARGAWRNATTATPDLPELQPSRSLPIPQESPPCPREDFACLVLNATNVLPRQGWSVEGAASATDQAVTDIQNSVREQTLKKKAPEEFPLVSSPDKILPSFDVPRAVPLEYQSSSSPS